MTKITEADIGRRVMRGSLPGKIVGVRDLVIVDLDDGESVAVPAQDVTFLDDSPVTSAERERIARQFTELSRRGMDSYTAADLAISLGARLPESEYVDGALYEITDGPEHWVGRVFRRRRDMWCSPIFSDEWGTPDGCTFTRLYREGEQP